MIPNDIIIQADTAEGVWLDQVSAVCQKDEATAADINNISCSAHFANLQVSVLRSPELLPLFRQSAHSLPMVKHGIDLIFKAMSQ